MELLDHVVAVLLLIFWGTSILFSIVAIPIYIPLHRAQRFPFLYILVSICCLLSFGLKLFLQAWSDIALWFWFAFPWWSVMLSIFSCSYWPSVCLLWENVCLDPLPIFNRIVCFAIEFYEVFIYFGCCHIYKLQIFPLVLIGCQRNCFWLGTQQCPLTFPHALLSCLIFFLAPKCHIRKEVWCLRKYLANDKTSYIFNFYCLLSCIDLHPTSVPSYLCRDLNWKSGFLDQFPTSSLSVPWLLPRFWNLHFYNWNNNIIIGKKKKTNTKNQS